MSKPRGKPAATLHALLFGSEMPDSTHRVLVLRDGVPHEYIRRRGLRPCPKEWCSRALVVAGVDPELVLGDRLTSTQATP